MTLPLLTPDVGGCWSLKNGNLPLPPVGGGGLEALHVHHTDNRPGPHFVGLVT